MLYGWGNTSIFKCHILYTLMFIHYDVCVGTLAEVLYELCICGCVMAVCGCG